MRDDKLIEAMASAIWATYGPERMPYERLDNRSLAHLREDAFAALSELHGRGWAVVPVEITDEMWEAATGPDHPNGQALWDAVLAAAPQIELATCNMQPGDDCCGAGKLRP